MVEITIKIQTTLISYSMGMYNQSFIVALYGRAMEQERKQKRLRGDYTDVIDVEQYPLKEYQNDAAWQRYEKIREKYFSGEYKKVLEDYSKGKYLSLIDAMRAIGYDIGYNIWPVTQPTPEIKRMQQAYKRIHRHWQNHTFPYYELVVAGRELAEEENKAKKSKRRRAKALEESREFHTFLSSENQLLLINYALHYGGIIYDDVIFAYGKARQGNLSREDLNNRKNTLVYDCLSRDIWGEVDWKSYLEIHERFATDAIKKKFELFSLGKYSFMGLMQDIGFSVSHAKTANESEKRTYFRLRRICEKEDFMYADFVKAGLSFLGGPKELVYGDVSYLEDTDTIDSADDTDVRVREDKGGMAKVTSEKLNSEKAISEKAISEKAISEKSCSESSVESNILEGFGGLKGGLDDLKNFDGFDGFGDTNGFKLVDFKEPDYPNPKKLSKHEETAIKEILEIPKNEDKPDINTQITSTGKMSEEFYRELKALSEQAKSLENEINSFIAPEKIPTNMKTLQKIEFTEYLTEENLSRFKALMLRLKLSFKALQEFNEEYGKDSEK